MATPASINRGRFGLLKSLRDRGDKMAAVIYDVYTFVQAALKKDLRARAATTANRALSGLTAVDGVTPVAGDIILVKNQTTQTENGLYYARSSTWDRVKDDLGSDVVVPSLYVIVKEGTVNGDTVWLLTNDSVTVGSTNIAFSALPSAIPDASVSAAKLIDDTFDAAAVLAKFATDSFDNAQLLKLVKDGAFAASTATRALFADAIWTAAKLTADVVGAPQLIITSGATAVNLTSRITHADGLAATDDITSTLADGSYDGQRKTLMLGKITALKTWVITPTNFFDGTTITLDAAGDWVELTWSTTKGKWMVTGGNGYTVA